MSTPAEKAQNVIEIAGKALTLLERIVASLGRGDAKKRAQWLRLRAIKRDKVAKTTKLPRRRQNAEVGAAADRAAADVLDPPGATCSE